MRVYVRDVVRGVVHLHKLGIAHRDLKCANLLLADDERGGVKIADFGTAKRANVEEVGGAIAEEEGDDQPLETARCVSLYAVNGCWVAYFDSLMRLESIRSVREGLGSAFWMAPELVRAEKGADSWRKADIWGVGCVLIEMATGRPPWVRRLRMSMHTIVCLQFAIAAVVCDPFAGKFVKPAHGHVPHRLRHHDPRVPSPLVVHSA